MIGHYLLTLTTEQEDRVLTSKLGNAPAYFRPRDGCRCLVGAVRNAVAPWRMLVHAAFPPYRRIEPRVGLPAWFDLLCLRFGDARIANAIRNRILSNRARRVLLNRPVQLETVTP